MIHFGTGGWRAVIGDEFTKANLQLLAAGLCRLMDEEGHQGAQICLGYDRRFLAKESAHWLAEVLAGNGYRVLMIDRSSPTPLIMFTVKTHRMPYGAMVTASHNPAIYNGVKVCAERLGAQSSQDENRENRYAQSHIVNHAIAYMEAHYAEKLTLQEVADSCYVSQWHLSKLLNKQTDGTFYDALNEIRIREAKRLLGDPKLRVGDIGALVGYQDPAHFARVFKKLTGMSANEYRNSL